MNNNGAKGNADLAVQLSNSFKGRMGAENIMNNAADVVHSLVSGDQP